MILNDVYILTVNDTICCKTPQQLNKQVACHFHYKFREKIIDTLFFPTGNAIWVDALTHIRYQRLV